MCTRRLKRHRSVFSFVSFLLKANLFSHGEIGLDAIVPTDAMGTEMHLLREVATFSRMRVIQSVEGVQAR